MSLQPRWMLRGQLSGAAVAPLLGEGAHGEGTMPADEALAMVVVEASGRPLVAANADLTGAGGLGTDLAGRFLQALADAAGLTVHVRLIEGRGHGRRARGDLQGARRRARPRRNPADRKVRWRRP